MLFGVALTVSFMRTSGLGMEFTFTSTVAACRTPVVDLSAISWGAINGLICDADLGVLGGFLVGVLGTEMFSLESFETMLASLAVVTSMDSIRATSGLVVRCGEMVWDASEAIGVLISEALGEGLIVRSVVVEILRSGEASKAGSMEFGGR